uniref:Uncharacterized protein n=1 Tax=Anguilla anguilla TaxID=7936 RepID=A0A0E9SNU9_ANGAN
MVLLLEAISSLPLLPDSAELDMQTGVSNRTAGCRTKWEELDWPP